MKSIVNPLLKSGIQKISTAISDIVGLSTALNVNATITGDPTGFKNPELITVTYNHINKTIELTGTVEAYFKGVVVPSLVNGFISAPHADTNAIYFLYYNGTSFIWSTSVWSFSDLMIAMVYKNTLSFGFRECHGLMNSSAHNEFHNTIGTYLVSGADLSNIVLNSTTVATRRPHINETKISDEDLPSILAAIATNSYSWLHLTGANSSVITNDNTEIISLSTNQPYYNQFNGSAWVQTLFANNNYGKIFVLALPVSNDATSQKNRFLFIQPQTVNSSLTTIQNVTSAQISLGNILIAFPEYVFVGEIIVRYTASNWTIVQYNKLTGTKVNQISILNGNYLSSVSTDKTLSGNGTAVSPLSVAVFKEIIDYSPNVSGSYQINLLSDYTNILFPEMGIRYKQVTATILRSTAYIIGDYVLYNNNRYMCVTAGNTSGTAVVLSAVLWASTTDGTDVFIRVPNYDYGIIKTVASNNITFYGHDLTVGSANLLELSYFSANNFQTLDIYLSSLSFTGALNLDCLVTKELTKVKSRGIVIYAESYCTTQDTAVGQQSNFGLKDENNKSVFSIDIPFVSDSNWSPPGVIYLGHSHLNNNISIYTITPGNGNTKGAYIYLKILPDEFIS